MFGVRVWVFVGGWIRVSLISSCFLAMLWSTNEITVIAYMLARVHVSTRTPFLYSTGEYENYKHKQSPCETPVHHAVCL